MDSEPGRARGPGHLRRRALPSDSLPWHRRYQARRAEEGDPDHSVAAEGERSPAGRARDCRAELPVGRPWAFGGAGPRRRWSSGERVWPHPPRPSVEALAAQVPRKTLISLLALLAILTVGPSVTRGGRRGSPPARPLPARRRPRGLSGASPSAARPRPGRRSRRSAALRSSTGARPRRT